VTLQDLIALFRAQVSDEWQPYLWSDPEVLQYAVDAQDMFVRAVGGLADVTVATADIGSPQTRLEDLALTADEPYSDISPYVLRIRSARLLTVARDVRIGRETDMKSTVVQDYGQTYGLTFDDEDTGNVTHGILGIREGKVRWVRVPSEADTCRMHVFRLPYPRIEDQGDALEIAAHHHYHLMSWMKHLAYSKQDAEARDDRLALESRQMFEAYCARARGEQERVRYRPGQVQYGGL
jgi:hypothetical protein